MIIYSNASQIIQFHGYIKLEHRHIAARVTLKQRYERSSA